MANPRFPIVQDLLAAVDSDPRLEILPLTREILALGLNLGLIEEMHDRLIVASGLFLRDNSTSVEILTRDAAILGSGQLDVNW